VRIKRIVFSIVLFFNCSFTVPPLFAQEAAFQFTPVSAAGSGGMHVAAEEGVYTLLGNPALLNAVNKSMFLAVSFGIGDIYQNGKIQTSVPPARYMMSGPLAIGIISKGVGYGFFNCLQLHEGGLDAHFVGSFGIDWILIDTPGIKLDFGLSPRLLLSYQQAKPDILFAASITPGILCSLGERFSLGISYNDAASIAYFMEKSESKITRIYSSLNIGIAAGIVSRAAFGLTLFADYRNILGFLDGASTGLLRQIGVGARIDIQNNFWLSLGMFELSPTAGFGLNLGVIKLEVSLFSNGVEAGIKITRD
jgi:hypothetical protein